MKKKFSLATRLILILAGFMVLVFLVGGLVSGLLLDRFYKNNRIKNLQSIGQIVATELQNGDFVEALEDLSLTNEVCVRLLSDDLNVMGVTFDNRCALGRLNDYQLMRIKNEVIENGGSCLFTNYVTMDGPGFDSNFYIYGLMSDETLILVASNVMPMNAMAKTFDDSFLLLGGTVFVACIIVAFAVYFIVLKPLRLIESEARNLPRGEYVGDLIVSGSMELDNLNNTLVRANEEIIKADRAKQELIANVSHDLRTPLTMIVGYGELMKDVPEEKNDDNLDIIIAEAKRLSALVNDLLAFSTIDGGDFVLNKEECSLNELLSEVYHQYGTYCASLDVDFSLQLLDDRQIVVDRGRIKQVLYNFLNNALNYFDKEEKKIVLGVEEIDGNYRVFVYDNGSGIEEADLVNIWDRYYKVDKQHRRVSLGSGIGLSLARSILKKHNLKYGVDSTLGAFSKFYFEI